MFDFDKPLISGRRLLQPLRAVAAPRCRLICLPCAGGSAAMFRQWPGQLPADVEVLALHAPGRGARFAEAPYQAMAPLVDDLLREFQGVSDLPYVMFGHSLGARIGYELCRRAESAGLTLPEQFIVAGSRSPDMPCFNEPTFDLPEPAFVATLAALGGTPPEILQNEEMLRLLLPALRADFQIAECYMAASVDPICCPITLFAGKEDLRAPVAAMLNWQRFTPYSLNFRLFDGGHFFVSDNMAVIQAIQPLLSRPSVPGRPYQIRLA